MNRPKIVVFCGSSKFVDIMAVSAWLVEREEKAISMGLHLLPGWYRSPSGILPHDHLAEHENVADEMDSLHLAKIDLANEVFVVNYEGYIGDSTKNEISHAINRGIPVRYYMSDPIGRLVDEIIQKAIARETSRACRECGCTDDDCSGCIEVQGSPCHWVEEDLCSRCAV